MIEVDIVPRSLGSENIASFIRVNGMVSDKGQARFVEDQHLGRQ